MMTFRFISREFGNLMSYWIDVLLRGFLTTSDVLLRKTYPVPIMPYGSIMVAAASAHWKRHPFSI